MPRYRYVCDSCDDERLEIHLSTQEPEYWCRKCYVPARMTRALTMPHITKDTQKDTPKIGDLTKEYIKSNKKLLEEEKQKAMESTHE